MKQQLNLRIIVVSPPAGVRFAMQRGRNELVEAETESKEKLVFHFTLSVMDDEHGPNFTGPFAQGPRSARFVYVNSGQRAGQSESQWDRRAKIPLKGLTAELIQQALATSSLIETTIAGTGRDGGPSCATVPLQHQWRLVSS